MGKRKPKKNQEQNKDETSLANKEDTLQKKSTETTSSEMERPKSKKELRKERKLAKKRASEKELEISEERPTKRLRREEKERALDRRFQEQDRIRREKEKSQKNKNKTKQQNSKQEKKKTEEEPDRDLSVLHSIFQKQVDPTTGATTCRLGVKYVDKKIGNGPEVGRKSLVTVKYQLRGGGPNGLLIDSSKNFKFRLGKGEVIQGWDIGLEGMRIGGIRQLFIPPKAGYGSQDVGAGPGAMLFFSVTLLDFQ